VAERPLEDLRILEDIAESVFELTEAVSGFVVHADMLLRPRHHVANAGEADVDLLAVGPRPVDPAAPDATAKAGSGGEDERRQYRSHLFPFDILEDAVALTAARLLEVSRWAKGEPRKNLHQLVLERFAAH